jgi:hypothetical protein
MIVSAEALAALEAIEHGAQYNVVHTTARELIEAGYACDEWGKLGLTEHGRCYLRRGTRRHIQISDDDDHVYDMSVHMMQVPKVPIDRKPSVFWKNCALDDTAPAAAPLELIEEAPTAPLPAAETRRQEMLRAAGVASGVTGIWPEQIWVEEFVKALDGVISERI